MVTGKIEDFVGGLRMDPTFDEKWDGSDYGLRTPNKKDCKSKYSVSSFSDFGIDEILQTAKPVKKQEPVEGRLTGFEHLLENTRQDDMSFSR